MVSFLRTLTSDTFIPPSKPGKSSIKRNYSTAKKGVSNLENAQMRDLPEKLPSRPLSEPF